MPTVSHALATFPSVSLPSQGGGLPVEVSLISQMGVGAGDALIAGAMARQRGHDAYVDALDEPSARLGGMDLERGDRTALYSFAVGAAGHPFHRHAGHRVFTAVSGSGGAQLCFSTASPAQIAEDPERFLHALHHVNVPPDALFVVRFGGDTWHRFLPLKGPSGHPALFAVSCHTDELGGALSDELRQRVLANSADVPTLTDVLPLALREALERLDPERIPTTVLSLNADDGSTMARWCGLARSAIGPWRARLAGLRAPRGFLSHRGGSRRVTEHAAPAPGSLLRQQLPEGPVHEDAFTLELTAAEAGTRSSRALLEAVLDGFVHHRSLTVSRLMAFRNVLVKPLGLRTSPLACPVSSLLSDPAGATLFAGRFPVLALREHPSGSTVEVVLGADDKHLRFRSCVGVERRADGSATVSLGTRVQTHNGWGLAYMALIDRTHKRYVSPTILRLAVDHAVREVQDRATPDPSKAYSRRRSDGARPEAVA